MKRIRHSTRLAALAEISCTDATTTSSYGQYPEKFPIQCAGVMAGQSVKLYRFASPGSPLQVCYLCTASPVDPRQESHAISIKNLRQNSFLPLRQLFFFQGDMTSQKTNRSARGEVLAEPKSKIPLLDVVCDLRHPKTNPGGYVSWLTT